MLTGFWPETLISARTTISLPPLFTTGLSLMLTLAFLNFQHGAGVGADQQGLELFSQRLFLCVSCSTPWVADGQSC